MKIKDIDLVLGLLEKIKMPSNPIVRHKLISISVELKSEKTIQDELRKTYITPEVIRVEAEKQEMIRSLHSEDGKIVVGEYKLNDVSSIEEYVRKHNNHPDFVALGQYTAYLLNEYVFKSELINIDETDDEMFSNLSDEEISHLMSIIK